MFFFGFFGNPLAAAGAAAKVGLSTTIFFGGFGAAEATKKGFPLQSLLQAIAGYTVRTQN